VHENDLRVASREQPPTEQEGWQRETEYECDKVPKGHLTLSDRFSHKIIERWRVCPKRKVLSRQLHNTKSIIGNNICEGAHNLFETTPVLLQQT
jgi:hypothetical protein